MRRHTNSNVRERPILRVRRLPGTRFGHAGLMTFGQRRFACALGAAGVRALKREGDRATPAGRWTLRAVLYRPDRVRRPRTGLPVRALRPGEGWCDDPADRNYNRPVRLPYGARAEDLWRDDRLYDIVVILAYNERPRVRGRGSAVFLHIAAEGLAATEGCVALTPGDLTQVLAHCRRGSKIDIVC